MTLDPRITFSRASLGTHYGSDGLLKYAAHNLLIQSQTFNTGWALAGGATVTADATTAPDATTTADRLNHVTAGTVNGGLISQTGVAGTIDSVLFSCYAKAGSKNWVVLSSANQTSSNAAANCFFDLATGVVGNKGTAWTSSAIENVGGGWYRCSAIGRVVNIGAGNCYIRVAEANSVTTCTSPGNIYIWGAQLENITTATTPSTYLPTTTAAVYGPRFDYDPVTHAPLGLLIEEARTNVVLRNRDLTDAGWTKTNCTAAKNQTGIDGVANGASSLTASGANATCLRATTVGSSARYQSAYVKRLTGSGIVNMTMNGGTLWTPVTVTSSWTRVEIPTATLANPSVGFQIATSGDAIAVDYVQNENGVFATSPVPTEASTFARVADIAVMTGANFSSWYNAPAGTFVVEFDVLGVKVGSGEFHGIISADDNTLPNRIFLRVNNTRPDFWQIAGGTNDVALTFSTISVTAGSVWKFGLSYADDDFDACVNGGSILSDHGTLAPPAMTQLRIGRYATTDWLNGHVRRIRFFNVAKSDADLQALTAP